MSNLSEILKTLYSKLCLEDLHARAANKDPAYLNVDLIRELNAFLQILREDLLETNAKAIFPSYDLSWLPECDKAYFALSEAKKNELSQQITMLYKQENQFILQLVQYIQSYILDKNSVDIEQKILFIPFTEKTQMVIVEEEEEKTQVLSQSGATGTDSALEEPFKENGKSKKKKKKKKKKKAATVEASPLLDEILAAYLPAEEEKEMVKSKLVHEKDVCSLIFGMYLANKEAAAKSLELELQVKDAQLKTAENEEAFTILHKKYVELQVKYNEVAKVLNTSEYSLGRALKYQQERMQVPKETVERRHALIKRCNFEEEPKIIGMEMQL